MQALYQWDLSGADIPVIIDQFEQFQEMDKVDAGYFQELVRNVPKNLDEIDSAIAEHAGRDVEDLDPIERNVLRLCCYELSNCPEIPYKVVINEAIELTKTYGAEQGHKFVNGVIDKIARELRPIETRAS